MAVMQAYEFTKGSEAYKSEAACVAELMKLYQINGEEEKAKQMAKEIIKKPIKISSYKVNQIKEEARKLLEL